MDLLPQLTRPDNLRSAWERVRDNHGCAGADGVSIEAFGRRLDESLAALARQLATGTYRPLPLLRILVDKGNGEARPLSVPTVRDRVAQAAALNLIVPIIEPELESCSFAYRKGRSWRQAVYKVREYYDQGFYWVLDADIDAFFDSVPHDALLDKVKVLVPDNNMMRLIGLWVKAEVWDGDTLYALKLGIPQGSVVSPLLANLYLDEMDERLLAEGLRLVRYADDFVVLCKNKEKATQAAQLTKEVLQQMSLCLDEANIVDFEKGFRFLGVIFCRSMALRPFDREKKARKVLHMPPPLDIQALRRGTVRPLNVHRVPED